MKSLFFGLFRRTLCVISIILIIIYFLNQSFSSNIQPLNNLSFVDEVTEVDARYLVLPDSSIVFSANRDSVYQLFKYKNKSIQKLSKTNKSVFTPFLIKEIIAGLSDFSGNENYQIVPNLLDMYLNDNYVKKIFSFNKGKYIILQLKNSSKIFFINLNNNKKVVLFEFKNKLNGVFYSRENDCFIISYDDVLICYNIGNNNIYKLAENIKGRKLNPFIYNEQVFFVNNSYSEYYQIFNLNINDKNLSPKIFYETDYDVKLPKFDGNYLYFVEVVNNEYLLKRKKVKTNFVENITDKGVIYNYDFLNSENLIIAYSDFYTPKCIGIINPVNKKIKNISGSSFDISANYKYYPSIKNLSPAYELYSTLKKNTKGILLFFHPGLHSDFSPRWDTILMMLVENGYIIFAPNYPMSFGYGKKYSLSNFDDAVNDMLGWKKHLNNKYKNLPIYFISASSGNILMENVLEKSDEDVNASVSLFGLSGVKPNIKTLYILGKNDPIVNFNYRYNQLREYKTSENKLLITIYNNEGHWFRRKENIKDAVVKILDYFAKSKSN